MRGTIWLLQAVCTSIGIFFARWGWCCARVYIANTLLPIPACKIGSVSEIAVHIELVKAGDEGRECQIGIRECYIQSFITEHPSLLFLSRKLTSYKLEKSTPIDGTTLPQKRKETGSQTRLAGDLTCLGTSSSWLFTNRPNITACNSQNLVRACCCWTWLQRVLYIT